MILVTSFWRGSLHISPMRVFEDTEEEKAWEYADSLQSIIKVYSVAPDKEPKLLKRPTLPKIDR